EVRAIQSLRQLAPVQPSGGMRNPNCPGPVFASSSRSCLRSVAGSAMAVRNDWVAASSVCPAVSYGLQTNTGGKLHTTSLGKPATATAPAVTEFVPPKKLAGRIVFRETGCAVTSTNLAWVGSVVTLALVMSLLSLAGNELRNRVPETCTFAVSPVP